MKLLPRFAQGGKTTAAIVTTLTAFAISFSSVPSWALIQHTKDQAETIVEMIEQLEERHYAKLKYDDTLSSQHLDSYIEKLDGRKMFFLAADIAEFEKYRTELDDQSRKGQLEAGYQIFNRFQARMEARLTQVIETLPAAVEKMDFTVDESYELEIDDQPWAQTETELDERWRLHLKNQILSLKLADKPEEELASTVVKRQKNHLKRVQQYNSQDVFQIYANALTELYDPHTNYLSPRRSENFNINMSLSLEGIGAVLQLEDDYTKVARLVAAGPADKQGELQPADKIVGVGQGESGPIEDVVGWRLDEVVELIRGKKDSTVRLEVIPAKSKAKDVHKVITIVRNKVKLEEQSAQKEILEVPTVGGDTKKVGVIDIPAFYIDFEAMRRGDKEYKSTTRDVKKLLDELVADGVEGIVIDLRNNGGGSLQEANDLTGLFIEYGPTVQIRHSSSRVWRDGKRLRSDYYEGPLVVLINRLSASASEIFAGAIQDYQRGIVVGDQSFGKGTVQTLVPLTEGQLKITESKFYRISGESTQHRGVLPDVGFPSLYDSEEIGESSLDHALNWDHINPVRHRRYSDLQNTLPQLSKMFEERSSHNPDYIYLEDQVAMLKQSRDITHLPLNAEARMAMRSEQEEKALLIENKRRKAKGEELLSSLDEEDEESEEEDADTTSDQSEEEEDRPDVLLTEAGNVLVDTLLMNNQSFAASNRKKEKAL
ncbi:MAG: carboxyl-terminal processing protease [Halioglobus sp.]